MQHTLLYVLRKNIEAMIRKKDRPRKIWRKRYFARVTGDLQAL